MCECRMRAERKTRLAVIGLTAVTAALWGLAIGLRRYVGDQSTMLTAAAAIASTVILGQTVMTGVMRKRDHVNADATAAAHEAELAAARADRSVLLEVLRNATDDIALLPPVPEDNRITRPVRILKEHGA